MSLAPISNDPVIARLDQARALLAQCAEPSDAKKVADVARAAEVYAKRQKLSDEAIRYAKQVLVDATVLLGEMLKGAEKNKGGGDGSNQHKAATGSRREPVAAESPTLAEVGITKKESMNAQALATVKETAPKLFEEVRAGRVSIAKAVATTKAKPSVADEPAPVAEPHPFESLAARLTSLTRDLTAAMRAGGDDADKLTYILNAVGAVRWHREDAPEGDMGQDEPGAEGEWVPSFVQLRGFAHLFEQAAKPGKPRHREHIEYEFFERAGGILNSYALRRMDEKRRAKNGGGK